MNPRVALLALALCGACAAPKGTERTSAPEVTRAAVVPTAAEKTTRVSAPENARASIPPGAPGETARTSSPESARAGVATPATEETARTNAPENAPAASEKKALPTVPKVASDGVATAVPVLRERNLAVMGSTLQIRVIGPDPARLDAALDAAAAELARIEDLMTDWRPSPLEDLNAAAGHGPMRVPAELAEILAISCDVSALTDGAFDVTFAAVGRLWDFKARPPRVPSDEALALALRDVGWRRIHVDVANSTVELDASTRVGLGGIAQGFGADRAMVVLREHGIEHAIVNVSGDVKALGRYFDEPWEIAIVHPRHRDHVIAVLPVSNTCVVTSGDYERFFEVDGRRYHHILDPRTGRPSEGCMSATVVAPDATLADALATGLCVMGAERGMALVERLPRVEALLVDLEGRVHVSSGLRSRER